MRRRKMAAGSPTVTGGTLRWMMRSAALAAGVAAALAAAGAASASTWTIMPTSSDALTAVSCVSASDCMAVTGGGPFADGPADALRWNGKDWTALPDLPSNVWSVGGIACASATYCIAVGQTASSLTPSQLAGAWAWNGSTWTDMSAYNPGSTFNALAAIRCASASSCVAVGYHGNGTTSPYPLAESWNGKAWTDQPTTGAPMGSLSGVACASSRECEAVGAEDTGSDTALAMGLSGSKWVTQPTPVDSGALGSVSCWSTGCTAVGSVAESWNGSKWAQQGKTRDLEGAAVHCPSADSCTAVGSAGISVWNGKTWSKVAMPATEPPSFGLYAIACTNGGSVCTAVGQQGSQGPSDSGQSLAIRN
jgi:hypothetical protein